MVSLEQSSSKRQPYMARIDFVYSSCSCISFWIKFRSPICKSCIIYFMHRSLVSCTHFTRRHLSQIRTRESENLLQRLAENKELDAEDAKNELRWMRQSLPDRDEEKLASLVERRANGEPLQYILGKSRHRRTPLTEGSTDFGPLTLKCRAPTLIPRPETAEVFGRLASLLSPPESRTPSRPLIVVDLCTGSAPIPLLLRHHLKDHIRVKGYDFSQPAIELARENIGPTGLDIEVNHADILDESFADTVNSDMDGRVDLIVSNPPYIPLAEYRELPSSVRDWEDPAALLGDLPGGENGLRFYERIAELLPTLMSSRKDLEINGWGGIPRVAVEIGSSQGMDVMSILRAGGMGHTEVWQDQYDKDRMVVGWD